MNNPTPATPSVSVESEEYVLVPKFCSTPMVAAMTWGFNVYGGLRGSHRALVEMFDAPNPSPAAKSGEAEAVKRLKDAVEGECEGLALSDDQALAILTHVALATPSPQPADAVREAPDLHRLKWSHMPSYGEMSMDQLREAVSEAGFADRHHLGPFDSSYSKGHQQIGGCNYNSLNRIVTAFVRAALTEPAPAGEAVEPVASIAEASGEHRYAALQRAMQGMGGDLPGPIVERIARITLGARTVDGWWLAGKLINQSRDEDDNRAFVTLNAANTLAKTLVSLEDTARLREDLERVTRELSETKRRLAEEFANMDATMKGWDALCLKCDEAERERDDARKALETVANSLDSALSDVRYQPGDHPVVPIKHDTFVGAVRLIASAARSASREATR